MLESVHIALTTLDMGLTVWVLVKARHTAHVERKLNVRHGKHIGRHRRR